MVGTDGIADIGFFAKLLSEAHSVESMGRFGVLVGHFAYIVEQTCAACFLGVESEFGGHDGAEVSRFAGVLKEVLTVGGTILHLADHTNEFRMQTVYAQVDGSALAGFDNLFLDLFLHFSHHFLDARGVDTSVCYELVQSQTCYLAANGVEGREGDTLRSVVHYYLYAGCGFECTDISSFAANDTSFDLIVFDVEDGDSVLYGRLGRNALNGLNDNLFRLFVDRLLGLFHHVVDVGHGVGFGFVFE